MTQAVDFDAALAVSRSFYRNHNLAAWEAALPRKARVNAADDVIEYSARCGFDTAFAFPPFATQVADLPALIEETLVKRAPGLPDDQQYSRTYVSDNWDKNPNNKVVQRTTELGLRTEGPYFVLLSTDPTTAIWGKTGKQMVSHFESKNWTGLTVPEYLVLQRHFCERNRDHRFFATATDDSPAHWMWLTDSATDAACSVAMGSARGSGIYGCKIGTKDGRRSATPTLLLRCG